VTVHVEGLPPEVLAGQQTACAVLEDAAGAVREGLLSLSLDGQGSASANLLLSDQLKPGDYRLSVVICGWTDAADAPEPGGEPPVLASLPYTVTPPTGQFDRVQHVPSPDGRWTAILNETAGSLDLRRESDGETFAIFPKGSTLNAVAWSPDSRRLLAVRANWQIAQPGQEIQASGPIEIWGIELEDDQATPPERLFQPTDQEAGPGQIVFGGWSPDSRFVLFWLGPLSASIQADGLPLHLLDTQTGRAIPTGEVTLLNSGYQSWALDSSALAFTAGGYRSAQVNKWLDLFDVVSRQVTTVVSMTQQIPGVVAWSPRGDTIAYAAVPADQSGDEWADLMTFDNPAIAGRRVYLLDPVTGQYKRLNDADTFQDAPAWSEDGQILYYVQREEDTLVLMAADPDTGQAQPIEESRRPAPRAVGYYGQSDWSDLLAFRPGAPVEPFTTAAYIHFEDWSPDSRWLAYWLSSQEDLDNQLPGAMPGGTLHFADVATGETCAAPQFHSETDQAAFVDWVEDGRVVVVMGEQAFQGAPCQSEPFAALTDYRPEEDTQSDPTLSSDGRYRAATTLQSSANGVLTFETILTEAFEMQPMQSIRWQIDERLGDYGLGGQWVSPSQFLIYETLAEGPLLVDVQRGPIQVLTDLFGLDEIPSITSEQGYGLRAMAAPGIQPDTHHLVLSGVGVEANFPPAMLYHAESGLVETLPHRHVGGFSVSYEWLFLHEGVDHAGYEIGYNLWARRLEDAGGDWRLLAPVFDYLLWRTDESEMAFTQNETSVVWQTFPQGEPLGHWHTGRYWVLPVAFSPDGRYLAVVGNQPGLWQYGLFVLERLTGSP
jgi:Tol biopolymer transport system component